MRSFSIFRYYRLYLLIIGSLVSLSGYVDSSIALASGAVIALIFGHDFGNFIKPLTKRLLSVSIVGLGAGVNLYAALHVGVSGFLYTVIGICFTLGLSFALGYIFKIHHHIIALIGIGTAICGGSAIAALAPVLRAREEHISIALAVVFLLNALALIIFPVVGHTLGLNETQFGLWAALAIHDTSSVVGASMQFGPQALEVGTTVKLARALWIIPVVLAFQFYLSHGSKAESNTAKPKFPLFILGFLAMAALVTFFPSLHGIGSFISTLAQHVLLLVMFLIGASLTRTSIRTAGMSALLLALVLWGVVASLSLCGIFWGVVDL